MTAALALLAGGLILAVIVVPNTVLITGLLRRILRRNR